MGIRRTARERALQALYQLEMTGERMTRIDRNVLRLGIFELKYLLEIPGKVSINEAVELGKRFGTEESSAFINGLLDRIASSLQKT